jgi:preprotein translocase subunit SecA
MEDELMARFGGQQMEALMTRLQVDESMPIANPLVDRVVEQSQNRVEGANFDVRKHLLEYDDVLNNQRAKIYQQRDRIFSKDDLSEDVLEMLRAEVNARVANTYLTEEDGSDGAWRLLAWLSQTQPTLSFPEKHVPSFTIQLIVDDVLTRNSNLNKTHLLSSLIEVGKQALDAEKDYVMDAIDRILEERQFRFQDQLEGRLDTLDTFLEGLSYGSEEPLNPQAVFTELKELVRTRFELNPQQIRELVENPGEDLRDELMTQVENQLKDIEYKRLVGGVERLLGAPINGTELSLTDQEWEEIGLQIKKKVSSHFAERIQRYFDDPDDPIIVKSIELGLREISDEEMEKSDISRLLGLMAEGKQAAFDKKSHRRIWLRTQRLRYTFYAAALLAHQDPDTVESSVLEHLELARMYLQDAWGVNELNRLKSIKLGLLEEKFHNKIKDKFGDDVYQKHAMQSLETLPRDLRDSLGKELGKSVINNIYRDLFLRVISELWVEYLTEMEALRVAIGLEAYAQRDPLVQYKSRGFEMFQRLMEDMRIGVVNRMFTFQPRDLARIQAGVEEV